MSLESVNHYGLPIDLDEHRRRVMPKPPLETCGASIAIIEAACPTPEPDVLDSLAEAQYASLPPHR